MSAPGSMIVGSWSVTTSPLNSVAWAKVRATADWLAVFLEAARHPSFGALHENRPNHKTEAPCSKTYVAVRRLAVNRIKWRVPPILTRHPACCLDLGALDHVIECYLNVLNFLSGHPGQKRAVVTFVW